MPGRIRSLSFPSLFAALLVVSVAAPNARAHRLDAQLFVLPNGNVQVESWFSDGSAAKDARVQVFGAHEQLITEGQLNEQGVFVFVYGAGAPQTVVISAGAGHRKVLTISASALDRAVAETRIASPGRAKEAMPVPVPLAERDSGGAVKDAFVGVGFLLALAAFVLSLRNAQKLRALGRQGEKAE